MFYVINAVSGEPVMTISHGKVMPLRFEDLASAKSMAELQHVQDSSSHFIVEERRSVWTTSTLNDAMKERTLADRSREHKEFGFVPGVGDHAPEPVRSWDGTASHARVQNADNDRPRTQSPVGES